MPSAWSDRLLAAASLHLRPALIQLGDLETRRRAAELEKIPIDRPVFICGLPRSGSTLLLEILAQAEGVATHRYRDFPFPWIPLWWNRFQDRFGHTAPQRERAHGDGMRVDRDSPEAMEEPLWESFLPDIHDPATGQLLGEDFEHPQLEQFLKDHIRKILLLRGGTRYVSKGHYNALRIRWLAKMFPDARFIVPVRHPVAQVQSMLRVHEKFVEEARTDHAVVTMLRAAGHHEFGPARAAVNLKKYGVPVGACERRASGPEYYARQWAAVYGYLSTVKQDRPGQVLVVRYEDLVTALEPVCKQIQHCTDLGIDAHDRALHAPRNAREGMEGLWRLTGAVARQFGYQEGR